jgi:hypothetical protein
MAAGYSLRAREVNRVKKRLLAFGYPRLEMLIIVSITGGVGLASSYWLLRAGITSMPTRYALAIAIAYLVFLGLLWVWLRTTGDERANFPDTAGNMPSDSGSSRAVRDGENFNGNDGEFGGGGASGSFEFGDSGSDTAGVTEDALGAAAEAEEFALPLIVIVLFFASLLASLWIVMNAPVLFAELAVDGVLAGSLYHRLRRMPSDHWLQTAVRWTFKPIAATLVIFVCTAWIMQWYAPTAVTIGDVISQWQAAR